MSSGGSSKPQTVTQTNEPPGYVRPFLEDAAANSQWQFRQGPKQYYPGSTVTPFSGQTQQALDLTQQRALNGSQVTSAAKDYATSTLSQAPSTQFGSAANPYASVANPYGSATNPHLDATFNRAADSVQNRLNTGFASAGRNTDAARPVAAQEMNDLASQIYGGAYESERNRGLQYQSQLTGIGAQGYENERNRMASDLQNQNQQRLALTGLSPVLANQDYADLAQLNQVGAAYDDMAGRQMQDEVARWDYNQNAPGIALDEYIARLNSQPGSTITSQTPVYTNRAAGALGGAAVGQEIGSNIGSGYGGYGALLGGILGMYGQ